ncbi:MAG: DUF1073 domain-containing protein [Sphingomonas sp.]|uniref:anti-CBASS protein Acb1 family protein n=1 Tax=Sphingomonas sp. TaxID=28214 RepID=UPI001B29EABB|nr:anti-CBASS Acb1 family protein [Sphingomonas sp.]MBO9623954.1 DUF1073 domain-containing protein [Sphingomonas sp.]
MAWITDSLRRAIERMNPFTRGADACTALPGIFTHQLAIAADMSSGMLRKVIAMPTEDRVREWRDWQADEAAIALIEAEERRLGLHGRVPARQRGGALVLITAREHDEPLDPRTFGKGGLFAVNVLSRRQLRAVDWVRDLSSPEYGQPAMFQVQGDWQQQRIHPSRVICFRGAALPAGSAVSDEEASWGDSRLLRVFRGPAKRQRAGLVRGTGQEGQAAPRRLSQRHRLVTTDEGKAKLKARVQTIAEGESVLNATVFDAGDGHGLHDRRRMRWR